MNTFNLKNIPNLDEAVVAALDLFQKERLPRISTPYKRPLVVGSGNAAVTGKIIFSDKNAIFATESDYRNKIKNTDGVIIISASGSKHAPIMAKHAKASGKKLTLITNTAKSRTSKFADKEYVLPKNREPYTYNTSTYLGIILAKTQEKPEKIKSFIKNKVEKINLPALKKFNKFYILIPEEFSQITRILRIKFTELFGRNIAKDIETFEQTKHATTIVPAKNELFIAFGNKQNKTYGKPKSRLQIPLPKNADYGAMMAISYYIIGKIQKAHSPWFKNHINEYVKKASKEFGHQIKAIVE